MQGPAIEDDRTGLDRAALADPDQVPQIGNNRQEDVGVDPAPGLLVDGLPRRQVVRHAAPLQARAGDEAQPVEALAQRMVTLRRVLAHERQVGREKGPLLIGDIGWVRGAGCRIHTSNGTIPAPQVHNRL